MAFFLEGFIRPGIEGGAPCEVGGVWCGAGRAVLVWWRSGGNLLCFVVIAKRGVFGVWDRV